MKRVLLLLALSIVTQRASANAISAVVVLDPQTGGHSVSLSWTAAVTTGVTYTGFNVYRALCTGTVTAAVCSTDSTASFSKLSAGTGLPATAVAFTDSTVSAGTNYIYYVTSLCATCSNQESVPSNHEAVTIPANQPPPPTLSITSVAINVTGNTETITASWTDSSGTQQSFKFSNGQIFVAQGLTSDPSGNFVQQWSGPAGTPISFQVSNAAGQFASQAAR